MGGETPTAAAPIYVGKWRPLRPLATALVVSLSIDAALCVIHAIRLSTGFGPLHGFTVREPWLLHRLHPTLWPDPGGLLMWAVRWGTIALWLVWQFAAHQNLHERKLQGLRVWPWSGVAWWFIPFADLVLPFRAMRELWTRAGETQGRSDRPLGLLITWWLAFVAANVLILVALAPLIADWYSAHDSHFMMVKPPVTMTTGQLRWLAYVWIASASFRAGAALLAIPLVVRISRREDDVQPLDLDALRGDEVFNRIVERARDERAVKPATISPRDQPKPPSDGGPGPPD